MAKKGVKGQNSGLKDGLSMLAVAGLIATSLGAFYGKNVPSTALEEALTIPSSQMPGPIKNNDVYSYLAQNSDMFKEAVESASLEAFGYEGAVPLEMPVATFVLENQFRKAFQDKADELKLAWNDLIHDEENDTYSILGLDALGVDMYSNPSLCFGQVRVDSARELAKDYLGQKISRSEMEDILQNPETCIKYMTMHLGDSLYGQRENGARIEGLASANEIMGSSELVLEAMTEYATGDIKNLEGENIRKIVDMTLDVFDDAKYKHVMSQYFEQAPRGTEAMDAYKELNGYD